MAAVYWSQGTSPFQVQLQANPQTSKVILHHGTKCWHLCPDPELEVVQTDLKKEMIISLVKLVMTVNTPVRGDLDSGTPRNRRMI